jgi:hypothetical protein
MDERAFADLSGQRVGRFKVTDSKADRLVLTGVAGLGIAYLLLAILFLLWATTAWLSVLSGHHDNMEAAAVITAIALILLWASGSTLGTRLVIDGQNQRVTRTSFFGLASRSLGKLELAYVSLSIWPATPKRREKAFLHLMNERQSVALYIANCRTDGSNASQMCGLADRACALLKLIPRCEGSPQTAPKLFADAYSQWAAGCPGGVQPLRRQVI